MKRSVAATMPANARHSSASNEHYTPQAIVNASRRVLGNIDLDPASSAQANKIVRADRYYTSRTNGFTKDWRGRVFLNPPGGRCDSAGHTVLHDCERTGACGLRPGHVHGASRSSQSAWWQRLFQRWLTGNVDSAIFVSFSVELLQTSQKSDDGRWWSMLSLPVCFPSRRVQYLTHNGRSFVPGKSPPHSSMIIGLPDRTSRRGWVESFGREFGAFGGVVVLTPLASGETS